MKKIVMLLLAAVMCFSLVACDIGIETPNTNVNDGMQQNAGQQETTPTDSTETENTEPQYETVELTLENWNEYFEIVDQLEIARNEFGEVWRVQVGFYLQLKPAYSDKCICSNDFALKIEWKQGYVDGTVNLEDETYEITQDFSTVDPVYTNATVVNDTKWIHTSSFNDKDHFFHYPYDFEVTNIKGQLYIVKEG